MSSSTNDFLDVPFFFKGDHQTKAHKMILLVQCAFYETLAQKDNLTPAFQINADVLKLNAGSYWHSLFSGQHFLCVPKILATTRIY